MNAYIYQADLWCEKCIENIKPTLTAPENPADENTFDSDEYPKGPYPDGGGESDAPQHCAGCELFLENSLTTDGADYVKELIGQNPKNETLQLWAKFYDYLDN